MKEFFNVTDIVQSVSTYSVQFEVAGVKEFVFIPPVIQIEQEKKVIPSMDLDIEAIEVDYRGEVTVEFNRRIRVLGIELDDSESEEDEDAENGRRLAKIKIEEFIRLRMIYDEYYDNLNKEISNYTALAVDDR